MRDDLEPNHDCGVGPGSASNLLGEGFEAQGTSERHRTRFVEGLPSFQIQDTDPSCVRRTSWVERNEGYRRVRIDPVHACRRSDFALLHAEAARNRALAILVGKQIAIYGLGRSGLAIARSALRLGAVPIVYDKALPEQMTKQDVLESARELGIELHLGWE